MATGKLHVIHLTIERPWEEVYAFASQPANMRHWASGLAAGLTPRGPEWIGDGGPIGTVRIRFAPPNEFGVIDHTVILADDMTVFNALRIVPNGDGAEVMFNLLQMADTDNSAAEADAAHIRKDLEALKRLLEEGRPT